MSLQFYDFPLSQPARAVHTLLILGNIPFTPHFIDVLKLENETAEYAKVTPTQAVPAIIDGEFHLFESHAIMRYIAAKHKLTKYYPEDPQRSALINSYLDWHYAHTRRITPFLLDFLIKPLLMNIPAPENQEERFKFINESVSFFETVFLGDGKFQFIFNHPNASIADFSAFFELTGLLNLNFDFEAHPTLKKYFQTMLAIPEVKQANQGYNAFLVPYKGQLNPFIQSLID